MLVFGAGLNLLTMSFGHSLPKVPLVQVDASSQATSAAGMPPTSPWSAMRGWRRKRCWRHCRPAPTPSAPFRSEETLRFLAEFDIARDFQPANTARTVDPRSLGVALEKLLPPNRNLVYDAGNFLGIVPYLSVPGPGHFKLTSDFASIGLGFGTALGVAKARPDETTMLVIGDGGFLMTMGELETVVREDLPLVVVLMNDCAYGAELHFLKMRDLPVAKSVFPDVDYAPIAEAFGFQAATIRTLDDLQEAGADAGQAGRTGVPRLQAERRRRRALHERDSTSSRPGSTEWLGSSSESERRTRRCSMPPPTSGRSSKSSTGGARIFTRTGDARPMTSCWRSRRLRCGSSLLRRSSPGVTPRRWRR